MLADVSESTVRALKPRSAEEVDEIVQKVIAHHLDAGQLDECELTIADLWSIRTAFVDLLQGVHHPRIKYPEQVTAETSTLVEGKVVPETAEQTPAAKPATEASPSGPPVTPRPLPALPGDTQPRPLSLVRRE